MPLTALGGSAGTVLIQNTTNNLIVERLHPNVSAYIAAQAGIGYAMSSVEINAVNNLVWQLVGTNLWSKMQVIYPCIGNNAASFKWNLKDTTTFNITFLGSWTFASTGMQIASASRSNYGRTGYTPSTSQTTLNAHASIYLRNFYLSSTVFAESPFGSYGQFSGQGTIINVNSFIANSANMTCQSTTPATSGTLSLVGKTGGLLTVSRNSTNATSYSAYNEGSLRGTLNAPNGALTTLEMYLGTANTTYASPTIPQPQEIAFASIGLGLSLTDIKNLYISVQIFQTALGRQV